MGTVGSRLNMPLSEPLALTPLTVPHVDYHQLQAQHLADSQSLRQTEKDARDEIIMDQLSKEMGAGIPEVEDGTMDFYAWLCCNYYGCMEVNCTGSVMDMRRRFYGLPQPGEEAVEEAMCSSNSCGV